MFICFAIIFGLLANNANAQVKSDGKWYFPDSVKALCMDNEQGMVATYKSLIENNRKWADENDKSDKRQLMEITEVQKKAIVSYEESWDRLGCASILYGSEKSKK